MARQLKLVRLDDFISDIDSLDLLSGGFTLARNGYEPKACAEGDTSAIETLTLQIQGTSQDDIASKLHSLDDKIKQACWWADDMGVERYQVWLRVQLDNESNPRQAQIIHITPPDKVKIFTPEEYNGNWLGQYILGIERTPWWEMPYPYPTTTSKTAINAVGGMVTLSETIHGDVPARIPKLSLLSTGVGVPLRSFWMGYKTSRFGNPANFVSVWSLDKSSGLGVDTSIVADATAKDGNKIQCTFSLSGNNSLVARSNTKIANVVASSANYQDQRGSYTVLLRAKMGGATSLARVRLSYSFTGGGVLLYNPVIRSRQVISGTSWMLYEMGTIDIPPSRIESGTTLGNFAIVLAAERLNASDNLDMDCLILVPIDEGQISVVSPQDIESTAQLNVMQYANGGINSNVTSSGSVQSTNQIKPTIWALPANDTTPVFVFAASDSDTGSSVGSDLTQQATMSYSYIPRWRALRGNET